MVYDKKNLDEHIDHFTSDKYSRGFQSGSLSPIFFSLNHSFPIINSRVVNTYNELAGALNVNDRISSKLDDYVINTVKINAIALQLDPDFEDTVTFDAFCYWYDKIFAGFYEEEEDLREYTINEKTKISEIDYNSYLPLLKIDNLIRLTPHSIKRPDMVKIKDIIDYCDSGRWVLPNFQRYFDWKKK